MDYKKSEQFIIGKLKRELPDHLYYHSMFHVKDVLSASVSIATSEGVVGEDLTLLKTAVLYHDSGFTIQSKDHEQIGCDIARATLPDFGYSDEQIQKICGMIMATKIPQKPHTLLEQIICDADLDYLGRDDYWKISNFLYKEIQVYMSISDLDWHRLQVRFLEEHHYFTATSNQLRRDKKNEYLQVIKENLSKLENS